MKLRSAIGALVLAAASSAHAAVTSVFVPLSNSNDVVIDDLRNRAYVATTTGLVHRYDLGSSSLLSSWTPGVTLRALDITPDSSTLYITDSTVGSGQGIIRKVDIESGVRTNLFYTTNEGAGSWDIAVLNNGKAYFTADGQFSATATAGRFIDLATGTITTRAGDSRSRQTAVFRDRNRSKLFLMDTALSTGAIQSYDVATDTVTASTNRGTPLNYFSAALSPNGSLLAYEGANVDLALYNTSNLSLVDTFPHYRAGLGFNPYGLLFMADESTDMFRVYNPATGTMIDSFSAGFDLAPFTDDPKINFTADGSKMIYQDSSGLRIYSGVVVPEPTSLGVIALATLGLLGRRRRAR